MQLHSESAMELDLDQVIPQAGHPPALLLRPWKWFQRNQLIRRQNSTNMIVGFVIAGAIVLLVSYLHTTGFFNDPQQELLSYAGFNSLLSPTASPPLTLPATPNLSPSPQPPPPISLSSFNSTTGNVSLTPTTTTTPPPLNPTLNPTPSPLSPAPAFKTPPLNPTPPPPVDAGGSNSNNMTGPDDWKVDGVPSPAPEECNDLVVYYQNMSVTWHHMRDEELLRKALEVDAARRLQLTRSSTTTTTMEVNEPSRRQSPRVPRIAYMFLTRGAMPFAPLWDRYFRGHQELHSVYVHAHPRYVPDWPPHSPFFRRFVPSKVSDLTSD